MHDLLPIRTWIFDLDNTLYPPEARLFDQMHARMTDWVMEYLALDRGEADRLRSHYADRYGTTLAGLMAEHGAEPAAYLERVHDLTLDHLAAALDLARAIAALPGRRIVFTNGSEAHAGRVLAARGLTHVFDAVYGVEAAEYRSKPDRAAFEVVLSRDGSTARGAAMFEDDPRNLEAPHAMGMRCVHVGAVAVTAAHVHHSTPDLQAFLSQLSFR